jgi:hypothetical protein
MQVNTRNKTSTFPIVGPADRLKPSQTTFIRPAQMSLFARVTSYPPLGQVTCLQRTPKTLRPEEVDAVSKEMDAPSQKSQPTINFPV